MIQFANIEKKFKHITALTGVSFIVSRGDILGILGPNGSGKTTLMNLLLGFLKPTGGELYLHGKPIGEMKDRLHLYIGAVLETPRFFPSLSAWQNLAVFAKILQLDAVVIDKLLETVELDFARNQSFNTFSLGMKQRLSIALSLLRDPDILIFDEPTNGLDPEGIIEIRQLIQKLAATGKTILLCSHLIAEVQQICNKVIILKKGRMISSGNMEEIKNAEKIYRLKYADSGKLASAMKEYGNAQILPENGFSGSDPFFQPGSFLYVRLADHTRSGEVNAYLAGKGIYLDEISKKLNSLEEFFLQSLKEE